MRSWLEIVRFDVCATLKRQVSVWYALALASAAWLAFARFVSNARGEAVDAPLAIAAAMGIASVLGLVVISAMGASAATRDRLVGITPLFATAPLSPRAYALGRLAGACASVGLLSLAAPLGLLAAVVLHDSAAPTLPTWRLAYLSGYLAFSVGNAIVATTLLLAIAQRYSSAIAVYVGALLLFLYVMLVEGIVAEALGLWSIARWLDPLGLVLLRTYVVSWTPLQKDSVALGFDQVLVWHRVLWLAIAGGVAWVAHRRAPYAWSERPTWTRRWRWLTVGVSHDEAPDRRVELVDDQIARTAPRRSGGLRLAAWHIVHIARWSFRTIVRNRSMLALAVPAIALLMIGPAWFRHLGTPILASTAMVVDLLVSGRELVFALAAPLLVIVYAGEVVWRDRDAGLSEVMDVTPVSDVVLLAGRVLGLACAVVLMQIVTMAGVLALQVMLDAPTHDLALVAGTLLGPQLARYLLLAVLAVVVHVTVDHKFLANALVCAIWAAAAFSAELGIERPLAVYGWLPPLSVSEMRGLTPALGPLTLIAAHWATWVLGLLTVACLLWRRGYLPRPRPITRNAMAAAAIATTLAVTTAVPTWRLVASGLPPSTDAEARLRAAYERTYAALQTVPNPTLQTVLLDVDLAPRERRVVLHGTLEVVNRHTIPVSALHITTHPRVRTVRLTPSRGAAAGVSDPILGFFTWTLTEPLDPGEPMRVDFVVEAENVLGIGALATNGTVIPHDWIPTVGYRATRELSDPGRRRTHHLPARPEFPRIEDVAGTPGSSDVARVRVDLTVHTDLDHHAVGPGTLQRTWVDGHRRHFRYVTAQPIRHDFAVVSATFAVARDTWIPPDGRSPVVIEVVHHPTHARLVASMIDAARATLAHASERYGPYPHDVLRLVEQPGHGLSLHAAPINISYEEAVAQLVPERAFGGLDLPFAIIAHEVAHQWWGNQLVPAWAEGGMLLTEGLAWYTALEVVEQVQGHHGLDQLMQTLRDAYRAPRAASTGPLLRATTPLQAYREAPLTLYTIGEYLGHQTLDLALQRFLAAHSADTARPATALDFYRVLREAAPPSMHTLLADLLERQTRWQLNVHAASAVADGGRWRVILDVEASKHVVESDGQMREVPMDDFVEIGVLPDGASPAAASWSLTRVRMSSGRREITLNVDAPPGHVQVDPRRLLTFANREEVPITAFR